MSPLTHEPAASRGYLLAMAELLKRAIAPQLQGGAALRVDECVLLLQRLAQEISPSEETSAALQDLQATGLAPDEIVRREAAVLDAADRDFDQAGDRLLEMPPAPKVFDEPGFERYLQEHALGGEATQITQVRQLAGGRSKITTLVQQQGARALPAEIVVRQDWAGGGVQGTTVVSEFGLLQGVFSAGLKVPQPFLIEPSNVLGAPFLVASRLDGTQLGSYFIPPPCPQMARDLAVQMALMHRLPVKPFVSAGVPEGARTPDSMKAALDVFRTTQQRIGVPSPSVAMTIDWLERFRSRVDSSLTSLVHNDIGAHNLLIQENSLSGILDWELAGIDHPAIDLGYAREWINKVVPWEEFLQHYHEAGGPRLSAFDIDFYTLWSGIRLYTLLLNVRSAIASGYIRDMEVVFTAADAIPWLVRRICREFNNVIIRYPN